MLHSVTPTNQNSLTQHSMSDSVLKKHTRWNSFYK